MDFLEVPAWDAGPADYYPSLSGPGELTGAVGSTNDKASRKKAKRQQLKLEELAQMRVRIGPSSNAKGRKSKKERKAGTDAAPQDLVLKPVGAKHQQAKGVSATKSAVTATVGGEAQHTHSKADKPKAAKEDGGAAASGPAVSEKKRKKNKFRRDELSAVPAAAAAEAAAGTPAATPPAQAPHGGLQQQAAEGRTRKRKGAAEDDSDPATAPSKARAKRQQKTTSQPQQPQQQEQQTQKQEKGQKQQQQEQQRKQEVALVGAAEAEAGDAEPAAAAAAEGKEPRKGKEKRQKVQEKGKGGKKRRTDKESAAAAAATAAAASVSPLPSPAIPAAGQSPKSAAVAAVAAAAGVPLQPEGSKKAAKAAKKAAKQQQQQQARSSSIGAQPDSTRRSSPAVGPTARPAAQLPTATPTRAQRSGSERPGSDDAAAAPAARQAHQAASPISAQGGASVVDQTAWLHANGTAAAVAPRAQQQTGGRMLLQGGRGSKRKANGGEAGGGANGGVLSKMEARLAGSRFRWLNEALYTTSGEAALDLMSGRPELYDQYHQGFREQTKSWPKQPVEVALEWLSSRPATWVVADFGCGDARLAASARQKVHSFDLVATAPGVVACNMADVPLADSSVDCAVFCLALMGTDYGSFLLEARRVLRPGGWLWIAEVRSRLADGEGRDSAEPLLQALAKCGFSCKSYDASNKMFVQMHLRKGQQAMDDEEEEALHDIKWPPLKPCMYKRR